MSGDVREDFRKEDFEEVYSELREVYLENILFWEIPYELFVGGRDLRIPDSRGFRTPDSSSASSASSFEYEDTPSEGPQTSLNQPLQLYIGDNEETEAESEKMCQPFLAPKAKSRQQHQQREESGTG